MSNIAIQSRINSTKYLVDSTGKQLEEETLVENISSSGIQVFYDAINAAGYVYGNVRAAHDGSPIYLQRIEPKPFLNSKHQVSVIGTWRTPDFSNVTSPIIRFVGTSKDAKTNFDAFGNPIIVTWSNGGDPATDGISVIGEVTGSKVTGLLSVSQVEYTDPSPKLAYIDGMNSQTWRGYPKYSWLCKGIAIEKILWQSGWRIEYLFELDLELHIKTAVWRDASGIIPKGIDNNPDKTTHFGDGYTNVQTHLLMNFNNLSLPDGF